jgi:hypothetical protein
MKVKFRYPGFSLIKKKKKSRYPGFFTYDSPPLGCHSMFLDRKKVASLGGGVCCNDLVENLICNGKRKKKLVFCFVVATDFARTQKIIAPLSREIP